MIRFIGRGREYRTRQEAEAMVDTQEICPEVFRQQYGWVEDFDGALYLDDGALIDMVGDWNGQCYTVMDGEKEYTYWPIEAFDADSHYYELLGYARDPFF